LQEAMGGVGTSDVVPIF